MEGNTSVFKVFLPRLRSTALHASQERSSERIVEQIVDSRVAWWEVLQRLLRVLVNTLVKGFLALFSPEKKVRRWAPHSSPRVPASVSPSTSSAQLEGFFIDENDDVWMRLPSGQWMLLGSDQHVLRDEPRLGLVPGCSGW